MSKQTVIVAMGISVVGLLAAVGSIAMGDPSKDMKPAGQPMDMQLPPGWTPQDMQACMEAGTPGEQHKVLASGAGKWNGKNQMWMAPDTPPMASECVATITPIMDGRYTKCEITGDMPGMGPFTGFGIYGFDNVSKQYVSSWIDNMSTGMLQGTGELSENGKVLTWNYTYNCPITKKQTPMREVETITGPNSKTLEMWGIDPKSGKEFKMMKIDFTRQSS
ncbi:MAG: DUF1579 domain-containing protein [Phycisphaeraceae bacterium]|nr:DUF1579 domain-containing protein [Phycisphaeraceae bacterium]